MVGAEEALRAGLVTHVHPREELLDKALELAGSIAARAAGRSRPPSGCATWPSATCRRAPRAELDGFALAFGTEDQREGMDAFFEKRPPRFEGHAEPAAR